MSDPSAGPRALPGVGTALLAAVLFGLSTPLAKGLLVSESPQVLAGLLYLGSGVGLGALWLYQRMVGAAGEASLRRADLPWLVGAIGFGGILGPLLLLVGLAHVAASTASLLLNLEGVLTALLAWVIFRENVDRRIALGMLAIVAGGGILAGNGGFALDGLLGPLAIAGACLCWAIDNNLTQKISGSDPVQITALKGSVAGSVNLTIGLGLASSFPSAPRIAAAMLLGLLGYGLSLVLFVRALRSLGTARTGAYFSTAPFVGAAVSVLLWREPITLSLVSAGGLMAVGLWLHVTERHQHQHTHVPLSHAHPHRHDPHHQHPHGPDDPAGEPHSHAHTHHALAHEHPHFPDLHHRHSHE